MRQNDYKMVYSHMNALSVFPLFAAWRVKVPIRVAHNHSTAGKGEWKKNTLKYILRPFSKVFPNRLCACSEYAGKWLFGEREIKKDNVKIWRNAINIDRFLYSEKVRIKTREELGVENKFVIGHVGRFIHQKNHMFILEVFNEVYKHNKNSVLILVGTGTLFEQVKKRVHELKLDDVVIFAGNREDVENIYQAMDVFIFPSFYEGLGMVVVEAQVSGLPVIVADTVPEDAKICENFKYMSLSDSVINWANRIMKYQGGYERKNMKQFAIKAGYDIKTTGPELTEWYCKLLKLEIENEE